VFDLMHLAPRLQESVAGRGADRRRMCEAAELHSGPSRVAEVGAELLIRTRASSRYRRPGRNSGFGVNFS
jgi:hypothetical protein